MDKQKNKSGDKSQNARIVGRRVDFSMKTGEDQDRIITDPQGSYTGVPLDPFDEPIQDADDL